MGVFLSIKRKTGPTSQTRLIQDDVEAFGSIKEKEEDLPYPRSVFFILATELCERFSYYGMRTVLILYLTQRLLYTENNATVLFHTFVAACYFTPIFGAVIADNYCGKYRTILWLSVVYLIGELMLSISAATPIVPALGVQNGLAIIGLLMIGLGTGGIKPCVSAFGGDQFVLPQQERLLQKFFSIFYFSINVGSLSSTLVTPILREQKCFGSNCFFAAFMLPTMLMLVGVLVYVAGSSSYRILESEEGVLGSTVNCLWLGVRGKAASVAGKGPRTTHWLDHARASHPDQTVDDVAALTALVWLYLPLPVFWALFDQQGSRWTLQATHMDGRLGSVAIQPDQMQVVNSLLVLILVPLMDKWVYPCVEHWGMLRGSLRKMVLGGVLAAMSFFTAAALQGVIESRSATGGQKLHMGWQVPQYILISLAEVLYSVSGLHFSFNEAPASMKSVMQALWLLTIAVGNVLVVVVAKAILFQSQTWEFVLFGALMLVDIAVFAVMAARYTPYDLRRPRAPPACPDVFDCEPANEDSADYRRRLSQEEIGLAERKSEGHNAVITR